MDSAMYKTRVMTELKILTRHPHVQSFFYYESSEQDKESKEVCIYGYLLPRIEPYKYGAYKVRILLPRAFPCRPPILKLLTYIYHPAVDNNISSPSFCVNCSRVTWTMGTNISEWLHQYLSIIERHEAPHGTYCVGNREAQQLYHQNREQYEEKALDMVKNYAHIRPHRSIVSLKSAAKQVICEQVNFQSTKIDQLPLSTSLKKYLNLI